MSEKIGVGQESYRERGAKSVTRGKFKDVGEFCLKDTK